MIDHHAEMMEELRQRARMLNGKGNATTFESRLTLRAFEDIHMNTAANYLVKGVIPRAGLAIAWGPPKCGKSFWTFDLVMHIALGREYRGNRVQQGPVVYLALEGGYSFRNRVEAWRRHHLNGHCEPVPFYLLDVPIDLVADCDKLIAAFKLQLPDRPPAVVVIDTLNRALIGDENKSDDMARFIRAADMVRAAFTCAVIIVHHCGVAGSRPRGHTSLSGADDVQIAVERNDSGIMTVKVECMRDGDASAPMACRLERIELGNDDDGDPITSCIVVPVEGASASTAARVRLSGNQARFLDIMRDALVDPPAEHKTTANIPAGLTAITREWLKICCKSKGWFDAEATENNNRAKVSNMLNALAARHLIGLSNLYVWFPE
jgi:AAA domain